MFCTVVKEMIALHELGHCWNLAHRSDSAWPFGIGETSVMLYWPIDVTVPNQLDIDLVNSRH